MSAQSPSPPAATRTSDIVDLTEGMSDLDMDQKTGAEENNNGETKDTRKPRNKKKRNRANRRSGKGKKTKELGALRKLQDDKVDASASNEDVASVTSSKTLSETGTVTTEPLTEPFEPRKLPDVPAHVPESTAYDPVPILAHYKLSVVPDAGSPDSISPSVTVEKHGLFATKNIEAGTRIICEAPLITLPAPGDQVMELMTAFEALEAHEQEKIWSLNSADTSASELLSYMAAQITEKLVPIRQIANIPEDERTHREQLILADHFPKLAKASEWFRIAARWHVARYSLIDLPEFERNELPKDTPITGLFIETARLRHSCVPNCFARYNPTTKHMTVHTTKAIIEGEELTTSTISAVYYHNAASRAAELHAKFGTTCECEACNPEHYKFKKHEAARLAIHTRALQLEHFCTLVEIIQHDSVHADLCLRSSDLPDPDDVPDITDLRDAEATVLALIKNLKDTGCEGPELIRWYNALIDRIQPRVADALDNDEERVRWWRIILRHAIECEKLGVKCFGTDSEEAERARLRKVGIEGLIERARERKEILKESRNKLKEMAEEKEKGKAKEDENDHKKEKEVKGKTNDEEKEEWEIIATTGPIDEEEKIKDQDGEVVATLGRYKLMRK